MTAHDDRWDPQVAAWLQGAHRQTVDVETAARHLWVLHDAAAQPAARPAPARRRLASALAAVLLLVTSALAASFVWEARSSPLPREVTAEPTAAPPAPAVPPAARPEPEQRPVRQVVEVVEERPQRPSLADLAQALPGRSP